jgi:hypothetical protein
VLLQLLGLVVAGGQWRRKLIGAQVVHAAHAQLDIEELALGFEKAILTRTFLLDAIRIAEDLHAGPLSELAGERGREYRRVERHTWIGGQGRVEQPIALARPKRIERGERAGQNALQIGRQRLQHAERAFLELIGRRMARQVAARLMKE